MAMVIDEQESGRLGLAQKIQQLDERSRRQQVREIEEAEARRIEEERKNRGFAQFYRQGLRTVSRVAKENPQALAMWMLICEEIDASCGAVVASQKWLAGHLGVSDRTIRRWTKYLEEAGILITIPIQGGVLAYAVNPEMVWKGYDNGKDYASFATKTLVSKDGNVERRLKLLMEERQRQGDLFVEGN